MSATTSRHPSNSSLSTNVTLTSNVLSHTLKNLNLTTSTSQSLLTTLSATRLPPPPPPISPPTSVIVYTSVPSDLTMTVPLREPSPLPTDPGANLNSARRISAKDSEVVLVSFVWWVYYFPIHQFYLLLSYDEARFSTLIGREYWHFCSAAVILFLCWWYFLGRILLAGYVKHWRYSSFGYSRMIFFSADSLFQSLILSYISSAFCVLLRNLTEVAQTGR